MKVARENANATRSSKELNELVTYEALVELALFVIKALITINSGGAVVLLTFVGNAGDPALFIVESQSIRNSMLWFVSGLVLAVVWAAIAYCRNYMILMGRIKMPRTMRVLKVYMFFCASSLACFCIAVATVAFSFGAQVGQP